jgi:hypothetical protein
MNLRHMLMTVAICAAAGCGAAQANAGVAIDLTTPGALYSGSLYTLGFSFTVASTQTITALGAFDDNGDGLNGSAQVGLWDSSGDLLTSAVIGSGASGALDGLFRYAAITPFVLTPGQTYFIGAFEPDDNASSLGTSQGGLGTINPLITVDQDQFSNFNSAFSFPDTSNGFAGGAWLGANFQFGGVPEPATWALMLLGIGAIGASARKSRRRALYTPAAA